MVEGITREVPEESGEDSSSDSANEMLATPEPQQGPPADMFAGIEFANPAVALAQLAKFDQRIEHTATDEAFTAEQLMAAYGEDKLSEESKTELQNPLTAKDRLASLLQTTTDEQRKTAYAEIQTKLEELQKESDLPITERIDMAASQMRNKLAKSLVRLIRYGSPLLVLALTLPGGSILLSTALTAGAGLYASAHTSRMLPQVEREAHFQKSLENQRDVMADIQTEAQKMLAEGLGKATTMEAELAELERSNLQGENDEQIALLKNKLADLSKQLGGAITDTYEQVLQIRERIETMKLDQKYENNLTRFGKYDQIKKYRENMERGQMSDEEWQKYKEDAKNLQLSVQDYGAINRAGSRGSRLSLEDSQFATNQQALDQIDRFAQDYYDAAYADSDTQPYQSPEAFRPAA